MPRIHMESGAFLWKSPLRKRASAENPYLCGMTETLHIKNMVCDRCILVVGDVLHRCGIEPVRITLGEAVVQGPLDKELLSVVRQALEALGFELLEDRRQVLLEQIKRAVIQWVRAGEERSAMRFSEYLERRLGRDYSALSKLFSEACGTTLEKYLIAQKIERTKELLSDRELTLSEIADRLGYSSVAYLSAQFKQVTGMTPSRFREQKHPDRRPLDRV